MEFVFARAFEPISDLIHKYTSYKQKSRSRDPIIFEEQVSERKDQIQQHDNLSDEKIPKHFFNNKQRYTRYPRSISR